MIGLRLFFVGTFLALGTAPLAAADLTKIDRTIAKEPVYKHKPKYCLLVFGPEAKTRVWLVQDGDVLYVDRNGNGDLTETDERFLAEGKETKVWAVGDIIESANKTRNAGWVLVQDGDGMRVRIGNDGGRWQRVGGKWPYHGAHPCADKGEPGRWEFAEQARDAPIIHLNGPLTVGLRWPHRWKRGEAIDVVAVVGTPGLGPATFTHISNQKEIPHGAELAAEVAFPNRVVGGKPILLKFALCPDV